MVRRDQVVLAFGACLLAVGLAWGDVPAAKKAVAEGLKAFDARNWEKVSGLLAEAESQLKSVPAADKKAAEQDVEHLKSLYELARDVELAEKAFAEDFMQLKSGNLSPAQKEQIVQKDSEYLDRLRRRRALLSVDDVRAKPYAARTSTLAGQLAKQGGGIYGKLVAKMLRESFEQSKPEWQGWEQETTGPTWAEYSKIVSAEISKFRAPRSIARLKSTREFLARLKQNPQYEVVAEDVAVKSVIEKIRADRDQARAKLLKFGTALVEGLEQARPDDPAIYTLLGKDLRAAFDDQDPDMLKLLARVKKAGDASEKSAIRAELGQIETTHALKEAAEKNWPTLLARYSAADNVDPQNYPAWTGRLVHFTSENQMGLVYLPSPLFPFATSINDHPVAGTLHKTVAEELKNVEKKIGRTLGSEETDGPWEVIAVVTSQQGKLDRRVHVEGDGSGQSSSTSVEAPVVEIIGLKCGPLAVVAEPGTVNYNPGVTYWFVLQSVLIALLASGTALMQAKFGPLMANQKLLSLQLRHQNEIAGIGLTCAAYGLVQLLLGWIYRGFFTHAAIIAAGTYAGLDLIAATGLVPPRVIEKLRPWGVTVGLICLVAAVIKLLSCGTLTLI